MSGATDHMSDVQEVDAVDCPVCSEAVPEDELTDHVMDEHVEAHQRHKALVCTNCGTVWHVDDRDEAEGCCT